MKKLFSFFAVLMFIAVLVGCDGEPKECKHVWDNGKAIKEATCVDSGIATFKCSLCGVSEERTVGALGHDFSRESVLKKYLVPSEIAGGGETSTIRVAADVGSPELRPSYMIIHGMKVLSQRKPAALKRAS